MSFDLYFVPRPETGSGWAQAMEQIEASAMEQRAPSLEDKELWDRVTEAVAPLIPEGQVYENERSRSFDDGAGLQLSMHPGEISINIPYWFDGEQAEEVVARLRTVAEAIEQATGLVAYDPQADEAFLAGGVEQAAGTFDRIHTFMTNELGAQDDGLGKRPRWAFWRR